MKIFAMSDIHLDYEINRQRLAGIPLFEHRADILILAGDVSDSPYLQEWCFETLAARFEKVVFVPGNHDLWVLRDTAEETSFGKLDKLWLLADKYNIARQVLRIGNVSIVPLLGWYDYSFGVPGDKLRSSWADYRACRWPEGVAAEDVSRHMLQLNEPALSESNRTIITCSHFLPRIDLMPAGIPEQYRFIYPVLGAMPLEAQIRTLDAQIHIYGHSHVNRNICLDGITYINNAWGYPHEPWAGKLTLLPIYDDEVGIPGPTMATIG